MTTTTLAQRITWTPDAYLSRPTTGATWATKLDEVTVTTYAARNAVADAWSLTMGSDAPPWLTKAELRWARADLDRGCTRAAVVQAALLLPTAYQRYAAASARSGMPVVHQTLEAAMGEVHSLLAQGFDPVDTMVAVDTAAAKRSRFVVSAFEDLQVGGVRPEVAYTEALAYAAAFDAAIEAGELPPTTPWAVAADGELERALQLATAWDEAERGATMTAG